MLESLINDAELDDFIFEVKYDGLSFNGVMEIGALGKEILGFENCIKAIILEFQYGGKITDLGTFSIVVEAFENNCFKKRIKLVFDTIEKYPASSQMIQWAVGGTFAALFILVQSNDPTTIINMTPEFLAQVNDPTEIKLLKNKEFIKNLTNIINPLVDPKDTVTLTRADRTSVKISYSEKAKFQILSTEEPVSVVETERYEEVYGKIISMDIDATKNQISFKIYGKGERIYCSLDENLSINNFTNLLGKWVTMIGVSRLVNGLIDHITVTSIVEEEYTGEQTVIE